jgi:xanthine dehydrogenase accessory factor
MVASRRKAAALREKLAAEGAPRAALDALQSPVGLPIGAAEPEEIAVSIAAALIAHRRRAEGATASEG